MFQGKWAVQRAQETETFLQVLAQVTAELGIEPGTPVPPDSVAKSAKPDANCADGSCGVAH